MVLADTAITFVGPKSACWFVIFVLAEIVAWFAMLIDSWRRPRKPSAVRALFIGLAILVYYSFVWATSSGRLDFARSSSGSMKPTVRYEGGVLGGDRLLVDYGAYRAAPPKRGDIVVFLTQGYPVLSAWSMGLKRVAGLPNEHVQIRPPGVCIDGKLLTNPAIFAQMAEKQHGYSGYFLACTNADLLAVLAHATDSYHVSEAGYFLLGDHSYGSIDSRYVGEINRTCILGRAIGIVWPPTRIVDF